MKRKKLAAFGLVIALTASSSSAAFAAAVPAASNMETTAAQQMDQAEETDTDILSDSEAVELQQEIASYSNDGILLTAAAPSTIGGVATTDIINAAKVMIRKYEGSYSSVNANDNGALSIGKMQWHADRAKSLLRIIISGDAASAQAILGDALYNEILSDGSWSKRVLTADEAKKMRTLLATTQSQLAQDVQENTDVTEYVNDIYNRGIRNAAAVVYLADVENQSGSGGVKTILSYAKNFGNLGNLTLNEIHIPMLPVSAGHTVTQGITGCRRLHRLPTRSESNGCRMR